MNTPSEALAVQILDRLVAEGIILAADATKAAPKFGGGTMAAEDWRLYVEKAISAEQKT